MFYIAYQIFGALLWLIAVHWHLKRNFKTNQTIIGLDLAMLVLVSGLMGGRLFHVFYEDFNTYRQNPLLIFKIWEGGFVFYGGFLASFLTSYLFCYWKKQNFWQWADYFTPWISLGYIWGRFGCFLNGCCYGTYCDLPWAWEGRHPTQIYAILTEIIVLFIILSERKRRLNSQGVLFLMWIIGHGLMRLLFVEPFRGDFRGPELFDLSISSVISLILIALAAAQIYFRLYDHNKKDHF